MKFLPKQKRILFLPKFKEKRSQGSSQGKENFDDSVEIQEKGIIYIEDDAEKKKSFKENKKSKNLLITKEDQEELKKIMRESLRIAILPPYRENITLPMRNLVHLHFISQVDLREAIPSAKNFTKYKEIIKRKAKSPDWFGYGCNTVTEIKNLCKNGWPEGAEKILELTKLINIEFMIGKKSSRKKTRGRQGSIYHIHAARSGKLNQAWTRSIRIQEKKKINKVEIWIQIGASSLVRGSDMFWSPATALALAEILQRKRFSVRIMGASLVYDIFLDGLNDMMLISTCLKRFSNQSSIEELAFTAFPGNFRYYWLLAFCSVNRPVIRHLGSPVNLKDDILPKLIPRCKRIIVPKLRSYESSKVWLTKELKKILEK